MSAANDVMAFAETIIPVGNRLVSVGLDGRGFRYWATAEAHHQPRISPDGRLLSRSHIDETRSQPDVWVEDLERGTVFPVLTSLDPDMGALWSPDGRQLAFVTAHLPLRQGKLALNIVAADGTGIVRSLQCPGDFCEPSDWHADGTLLLNVLGSRNANVWTLSANSSLGFRGPSTAGAFYAWPGVGQPIHLSRPQGGAAMDCHLQSNNVVR